MPLVELQGTNTIDTIFELGKALAYLLAGGIVFFWLWSRLEGYHTRRKERKNRRKFEEQLRRIEWKRFN